MTLASLTARSTEAVTGGRRVDLVLRLSLLAVILNSRESVPLMIATAVVAVVAMPRRSLYADPRLWFALTAALALRNALQWEGLDNHLFLTMWWTLAVGASLLGPDPAGALAANGRVLVGVTFAFATAWKLISGQFLGADFFHYSLLLDDRFRYLAESVGGLGAAAYEANVEAVGSLRAGAGPGSADLATTGRIEALAVVITWWTIVVEAAIAVTWLVPHRVLAAARHASLLVFAFTTYLAVPVGGFGALLMVMALAHCDHAPRARLHWVAAFVLLLLWAPLWRALFG